MGPFFIELITDDEGASTPPETWPYQSVLDYLEAMYGDKPLDRVMLNVAR